MSDDPNVLVRTLIADATGICKVSGRGFAIEVIDGGVFERENLLLFSRGTSDTSRVFVDDGRLRCVPGARLAVAFDEVTLVSPSTTRRDAVVVKIHTRDDGALADVDPGGKPRRRWLARGRVAELEFGGELSPGVTALFFDTDVDPTTFLEAHSDRFLTREAFDVRTFLGGWVVGSTAFDVVVLVSVTDESGAEYGVWAALARYSATLIVASASGDPIAADSYAVNLENLPFPAGHVRFYCENTGRDAGQFYYLLGARG